DAGDEDHIMEAALEAGAEDFKAEPEGYEVLADPSQFEAVHKALESKGIKIVSAEITFLPVISVPFDDATTAAAANKLHELLEDHDDVKEVYSNGEFPRA